MPIPHYPKTDFVYPHREVIEGYAIVRLDKTTREILAHGPICELNNIVVSKHRDKISAWRGNVQISLDQLGPVGCQLVENLFTHSHIRSIVVFRSKLRVKATGRPAWYHLRPHVLTCLDETIKDDRRAPQQYHGRASINGIKIERPVRNLQGIPLRLYCFNAASAPYC